MAHRNQTSFPVLTEMFEDSLGLSEGLTGEHHASRSKAWSSSLWNQTTSSVHSCIVLQGPSTHASACLILWLFDPLFVCTVLQLENSYNALLVALDADQDEELLPPEGFINAGPITPEGIIHVRNVCQIQPTLRLAGSACT